MKKGIALLLVAVMLLVFCTSCESAGVSVPYYLMHAANSFDRIWEEHPEIVALSETLAYRDFTYSVYYERSENELFYGFNIVEDVPAFSHATRVGCLYVTEEEAPYRFFAKEGELFIVQSEKTYSVLQLDGLYSDFIQSYKTMEHPLDGGEHFQIKSHKEGDSTVVLYKAEITPKMEAELADYGAVLGETVFTRYTLGSDGLARKIEYSLGTEEGEPVLTRTFDYRNERSASLFDDVPSMEESVKVTVVYSNRQDTFTVPKGCYLGFDMKTVSVSLYTDEDCTVLFDREAIAVTEDLTLYAG